MSVPVITLDGPSGVGKGTMAQRLAARLGWHLLDSGALYRIVALAARREGVAADDAPALAALAAGLDVRFEPGSDGTARILLGGEDVTGQVRDEATGALASRVAAVPALREALLDLQHRFRRPPGLVADGRDMGTVVFPDATVKVFLTARPDERARRRYKQLIDKGMGANLADLLRDIRARDERDAGRAVAPLRAAPDAVTLDTSDLSVEEVERRLSVIVDQGLAATR